MERERTLVEAVIDVYADGWERGVVTREAALDLAAFAAVAAPEVHWYLAARFKTADWRVAIRRGDAPPARPRLGLSEGMAPFFPGIDDDPLEVPMEAGNPEDPGTGDTVGTGMARPDTPTEIESVVTETGGAVQQVEEVADDDGAAPPEPDRSDDDVADVHESNEPTIGVARRSVTSPPVNFVVPDTVPEVDQASSSKVAGGIGSDGVPSSIKVSSDQPRGHFYAIVRAAALLDTTPSAMRAHLQRRVVKEGLSERGVDLGGGITAHKLGGRRWRIWIPYR